MIGISIKEIGERIQAESALHYMTSEKRIAPMTPDSEEALKIMILAAWSELTVQSGNMIKSWKRVDDILEIEATAGVNEQTLRGAMESALFHLTLAHAYELSYPQMASHHADASVRMTVQALNQCGGKPGVIADGM